MLRSSEKDEESTTLGVEAHWRYIKTVKKAQEAAKKMRELTLNAENGRRMEPAVESTPHANAHIHSSTYEGAELITKFMDDESEDAMARRNLAKEQTGVKILLLSTSNFCLPTNLWPKSEEPVTKTNAFAFTKRKSCEKVRAGQQLGSVWRFVMCSSFCFGICRGRWKRDIQLT